MAPSFFVHEKIQEYFECCFASFYAIIKYCKCLMLIKEIALSLGGYSKVEYVIDKGTKRLIEIPIKQ